MYFYKQIDNENKIICLEARNLPIDNNDDYIEITEEEYNSIMAEIEAQIKEEQEQWEQENISPAEFMEMVEAIL